MTCTHTSTAGPEARNLHVTRTGRFLTAGEQRYTSTGANLGSDGLAGTGMGLHDISLIDADADPEADASTNLALRLDAAMWPCSSFTRKRIGTPEHETRTDPVMA